MTLLDSIAAALGYARPTKAETGPGVLPMMYDNHMSDLFGKSDQARIKAAQALYHINPWVNAAERAVTNQFANVEWHLEDEDDHEVDDEATPEQQAALDLIEYPQRTLKKGETQGLTRRALWSLTSRHMGLCGTSFWFANEMAMDKIPTAFLYINPARMTPVSNKAGYLIGWKLDMIPFNPDSGYPLDLEEVLRFTLDPADMGHWGIGLAEASGILGELWMLAAKHSGGVLSSGGRIAGITMPKAGVEMSDEAWTSLVRDMRTISEDPNAAKRNLIIKKPMDFLPTAASPRDLDLIASLAMSRDDILAFWGVPKSQIGMDVPSGLNSGATKDRDMAVLWQGAVHSRLVPFAEVLQFQLLDRWKERGTIIELEIEEPDFTEDAPKYQNAATAISQPLRNRERRAILGLDPFGDPAMDEAVWMPMSMTSAFVAPDAEGNPVEVPEPEPPPEPALPPGLPPTGAVPTPGVVPPQFAEKAGPRPFLGLRDSVEVKWVPRMKSTAANVLDAQRAEVIARIKRNAAHIAKKPTDTSVWWDADKWDTILARALLAEASGISDHVSEQVGELLLGKAAPLRRRPPARKPGARVTVTPLTAGAVSVAERESMHEVARTVALRKTGERITGIAAGINDKTRDDILEIVRKVVTESQDKGLGVAQMGDVLEEALGEAKAFDEYRSEMIARTETMAVYNAAALASYAEFGVEYVEAVDGDEDEACYERQYRDPAGQGMGIYTIAQADAEWPKEHPNGTLDWSPFYPEDNPNRAEAEPPPYEGKATEVETAIITIAESMKAPTPVNVVLPSAPRRTVVERDPFTGKIAAFREEVME